MSDTATQERRSALDEFAQGKNAVAAVPAPTYMPAEQHGAIAVQVSRSEATTRAALKQKAALLGERGYYRWPVKNRKKGTTDWVEGVSIKGAMALVTAFKNCRVSCPQIFDVGSHWRFHAIFIDYENGVEIERSFMQRKSGGTMGDDPARQADIAYQIGISKAERNVIVNALELEADFLLEECKASLVDKIGADLDRFRRVTVERVEKRTELARVEAVVGRAANDWLAPDIAKVIAMMTAVADGMATMDESFPPLKATTAPAPHSEALDAFARSASDAPTYPPDAEAGAVDRPLSSAAPATEPEALVFAKRDAIDKVLQIADDKELPDLQERLEALDLARTFLKDPLAAVPAFLKTLFATAVDVANGKLTVAKAKDYLRGL